MAFDAHKNLSISTVATAPAPATSGNTLVVAPGEGARFPAAPFNATVWANGTNPSPITAEIVRVTGIATDTLIIVRAQEGTTARAIVAGDVIAVSITAKSMADLESGTNFPQITTGPISGTTETLSNGLHFSGAGGLVDRVDNTGALYVIGGTSGGSAAYMALYGNSYTSAPGLVELAGNKMTVATAGAYRQVIHQSGGISFNNAADPGAGVIQGTANLRLSGTVTANGTAHVFGGVAQGNQATYVFVENQSDGNASLGALYLAAGGTTGAFYAFAPSYASSGPNLAAGVTISNAGAGGISVAAQHAAGSIRFYSGATVLERFRVWPSGGISLGNPATGTDLGDGNVAIGDNRFFQMGPVQTGQAFFRLGYAAGESYSALWIGNPGSAAMVCQKYYNANGVVGTIVTSGTATAYNTTSDARLKTDQGVATDPDVLRRTVVHDFTWTADGQPGRGVFAQEVIAVAPSAVSVGTDERSADGLLANPWQVDYSKFVPDLIVGWQQHTKRITDLETKIADLEATIAKLLKHTD